MPGVFVCVCEELGWMISFPGVGFICVACIKGQPLSILCAVLAKTLG